MEAVPVDEKQMKEVDSPPLKKRATKRGLSTIHQPVLADQVEIKSHVTNVYSSCVQRASALDLASLPRKPLFCKQDNSKTELSSDLWRSKRPKSKVCVVDSSETIALTAQTPLSEAIEDIDEDENSSLSTEVSILRSPSPVPPPPPVAVRTKARRVNKGIEKAFKTLDSVKGLLTTSPTLTPTVIMIDESPVRKDTQVVRVRHIEDIHRFCMSKEEMFYSLQQQMASLLGVDVDQIGLYLNEHRLSPSDTPLSSGLHLADIIVCHVLVLGEKGNEDSDAVGADSVRVLMQCPNSRQNMHMVVRKYLPFSVMFEKYAKMQGKPVTSFRFQFDGEILNGHMLPADVDLDDNDTIDVIEVK